MNPVPASSDASADACKRATGPPAGVLGRWERSCAHMSSVITWEFDQTVSVEGIATAAAAVGAASAYVSDVVMRWVRRRKDQKRGARGRMIIELAQARFLEGIGEDEVDRYLSSDDEECVRPRERCKVDRNKNAEGPRRRDPPHPVGVRAICSSSTDPITFASMDRAGTPTSAGRETLGSMSRRGGRSSRGSPRRSDRVSLGRTAFW
jgi:hypothetical protein